ncbi:hypothetical protein [Saccharothrix coeruleofusca]|uniref:GLTT repeat-containing protein n=1 Tax=Saccharothrix coeruleofusca TaxID=33919 RepID=A0A918ARS4_9PSEU|nr:hypothetical protein [Saccharothrix coeruleofusca]MBP2337115.1 hypothetical protein [Saccharothrix coeruleofusca]GGP67021.1 hypothetical protein GCM10010185_44840 [Saccharothrix coeruleofusca]
MSALRPRGLFRAAAMLAVGVSPLLAGSASATEAPQVDSITPKIGDAPEVSVADLKADEVISGKTVKLPATPITPQAAPMERDLTETSTSVLSETAPELDRAADMAPVTGLTQQLPLLGGQGLGGLGLGGLGLGGLTQQLPTDQLTGATGGLGGVTGGLGQLPVGLPLLG